MREALSTRFVRNALGHRSLAELAHRKQVAVQVRERLERVEGGMRGGMRDKGLSSHK
jgi:hypothetical protein